MINLFLETKRLYLEPLAEQHITQEYVAWLNNSEVVAFNRHGLFPNTLEKTKQYVQNVNKDTTQIVLALIEKSSSKHIGNIAIQNIDFINRHADISIVIGEQEYWGKGYAFEVYQKVFEHAFYALNLNKVYIGTSEKNISMQRVAEKLGMKKDGVKREALYKNGQFNDIYEYSLLKKEFLEFNNG